MSNYQNELLIHIFIKNNSVLPLTCPGFTSPFRAFPFSGVLCISFTKSRLESMFIYISFTKSY